MPKLEEAAKKFDGWMKEFEASHREHGHLADNNKALVSFLNGDKGFQYVKTYDELCQLAEILEQRFDYTTTNPPCSPTDFIRAVERANPRSFGDAVPTLPEGAKLQYAAEKFDRWMKEFEASHREHGHLADNNKALVNFLHGDRGHKYVETYEDICKLADILQSKGYSTTNPPCTEAHFTEVIEQIKGHDRDMGGDDVHESPRMR